MKSIIDDDKIIVFLNNKKNIDEKEIEEYFKTLILKLEDKFDVTDYNEVSVYQDSNYGMILEFKYDDMEYLFDTSDIKINLFKKNYFLYEIDYNYIDKKILRYCTIYKNKDKLYLKFKRNIDEINFSKILEYSDIIYGEKAIKIENTSKKVNYEKTSSSISRKT